MSTLTTVKPLVAVGPLVACLLNCPLNVEGVGGWRGWEGERRGRG